MPMKEFNYIFWDNDGVLVDTERYYLQASQEALLRVGIQLSNQQFLSVSLTAGRSIFDLASEQGVPEETILELRKWRDARYAEILECTPIEPLTGVRESLESLHNNIAMSIVTSSHKNHFDIIHSTTGLLPFFNFCLTREDYIHSKPSAEPYLLALQKSNQRKEDVLVIEDSPRGLKAAKAAGLTCWVIPGEYTSEQDFKDADRILTGAGELPDLIL